MLGVELSRVEDGRIRIALTPLAIHKRVRPKVDQHAELKVLPLDLLRRRLYIDEILRGRERCESENDDRRSH